MFPCRRIAVLLSAPAIAAAAQTHHVAPPEKVTRAVAVYEWTGDLAKPTASRLVPVSLFINGHFEDAGLYLARPVPFALEPGDLYSVEDAGKEEGTLAIEHARDFTTGRLLADQEPVGAWYGFGRFAPLAPPKPPPALHAAAHPSVIVSSSGPDRLLVGEQAAGGEIARMLDGEGALFLPGVFDGVKVSGLESKRDGTSKVQAGVFKVAVDEERNGDEAGGGGLGEVAGPLIDGHGACNFFRRRYVVGLRGRCYGWCGQEDGDAAAREHPGC